MKVLDLFSCICYLVQFQKDKSKNILFLLNSESEINVKTPAYVARLGFKVRKTDVGT